MRPPAFTLFALFPAVAWLVSADAGCGDPVVSSICSQICDCSPCTRNDVDTCMTAGANAEATAQKKKCTSDIDALFSCYDENLSCQDGAGPGTDKCASQESALTKCAGIGNPFTTPCIEAAEKSASCNGGQTQVPAQATCSTTSACQSLCVLAQPCDVIVGGTFNQQFQDCMNQCNGGPSGSGGSFGSNKGGL